MKKYGNVWIFEVKLEAGERKQSHKHEFDHIHQVLSGRALIKVADSDGTPMFEEEVNAGDYIRVPKDRYHSIEALSDYQGNCIHALRDTNNEVVETNFKDDGFFFEPNKDI